ncbi:hypothetical protein F0562_025680 [Nyssa sinensis]|uniref:Uncharacterized protein n=1 Tax=Nyssa sinensis TaxID=561372 RepID=A0A5J5B8S8_9ASTE|nr:hypothetical protein F0562_025680 [Nyssa sinensis]
MSLEVGVDSLSMKTSSVTPASVRKNPVKRAVRHFSPPPGFSSVPSELVDESFSKSETIQNWVRSDKDATTHLVYYLDNAQHMERRCAMKLINCISNGHPAGVPPLLSPAKENAVTTIASILTNLPKCRRHIITEECSSNIVTIHRAHQP